MKFESKATKLPKPKTPASVAHLPGFCVFSNGLTASGVCTGTNNNAAENYGLEHDVAKVNDHLKQGKFSLETATTCSPPMLPKKRQLPIFLRHHHRAEVVRPVNG